MSRFTGAADKAEVSVFSHLARHALFHPQPSMATPSDRLILGSNQGQLKGVCRLTNCYVASGVCVCLPIPAMRFPRVQIRLAGSLE